MSDIVPTFLNGVFDWRERGYHWSEPPFDLLSDSLLQHDDPWVVLAAVVARAKQGDSSEAPTLARFFARTEPFALNRISLLVFADIAASTDLFLLRDALVYDDLEVRQWAASAASMTGQLALVPAMVGAWNAAWNLGDHESIGFSVTDIVEDPEVTTELMGEVGVFHAHFDPKKARTPQERHLAELFRRRNEEFGPPKFPGMVMDTYNALVATHGANANLWEGELVCVRRLANRFMNAAKNAPPGSLIKYRHRFEAMTGLDCHDFFYAFKPQRLAMQATLEELLQSPLAYPKGQRYFWGHPLP